LRKADKNPITINIFSNNFNGNKISLDGKSLLTIVIVLVCLALVVSFCSPELHANIIRLLISIIENY
jgi:hypothetical protein